MWLIIALLSFLQPSVQIFAQEKTIPEHITEIAEELASFETDPFLSEMYAETLSELSENKVRINTGDEQEIRRLFFLSEFAIRSLADYVVTTGPILSFQEIANIPGFNRELAEMTAPFISFETYTPSAGAKSAIHQTLLSNIIIKPGEYDPSTPGSAMKSLIKYKITGGSFSGGITAEKDPGEKFITGKTPLTDFFSFHFSYNGKRFLKRAVIGDFSARFGHGIAVNTTLGTGFSLTAPGNLAGKNEIKAYTSSDENNFFRGAAATMGFKNLELSILFSVNNIDASLNSISGSEATTIRNLTNTGYHNSQSTIRSKDVVREQCNGINLTFSKGNLKSGITVFENRFSMQFQPDYSDPANIYDFKGDKNRLYSFYYNSIFRRILLSGEISSSDLRYYAFLQAVSMRLSDRLNLSFIYRNYSPGYHSFHGKGTGSSSAISAETGLSGSFTFEAAKYLFLSAGCDLRSFGWMGYRTSSPALAKRYEVRIKYLPSGKLNLETLYQFRSSEYDGPERQGIPLPVNNVTQTARISFKYLITENLSLSSRLDFKKTFPGSKTGILMLQDLILKMKNVPLSVWFRYSIFNTDDYGSGIYTWENDLLYSYSIPVLYGSGSRSYLMIKWEPAGFADLRIKYGFTSKSTDPMMKETRDEIKLQLYLRF